MNFAIRQGTAGVPAKLEASTIDLSSWDFSGTLVGQSAEKLDRIAIIFSGGVFTFG
jgi:hypothetical protein